MRKPVTITTPFGTPEETAKVYKLSKRRTKEIMDMVQKLSPGYRTVFNLHVIDGFKHEEIADQLNISVGTSKSNLAKARANIQKMLKEANLKFYEQQKAV